MLQQAVQAIIKQHHVDGLLRVSIEEHVKERVLRAYGHHPASLRVGRTLNLHAAVDEQAVEAAIRRFGWRVYATNQAKEMLSLEQAVLVYREEYLVEHGFGRLKGKPESLSPMYVQSDRRAIGLVCLLSIGLRVLTLLEFGVRQRYNSASYPCWTFRPTCIASSVLNSQNRPENGRTMSLDVRYRDEQ
ncbi:MAG: hypothetical protein AUF64_03070 [Chloroflexi bacterium 13_1_20CM_54_36]|nr:MAG: hypothetical protein AUF64_03070 [Chloroflexi bacterium 13_1_20CM_54_36]